MNKGIWILLVIMAGAMLPIQAGLNTRMGKVLDSPSWATLISFIVGAIGMLAYVAVNREALVLGSVKSAPAHLWVAGLLGAFYVTVMVLAFPRLGPALTFGLAVAGQLLISLLLDHFNLLVPHPHPINLHRILGILLIIAGVVIIRKF
ncbi:MAG: DMT family transporter [Flectobacillus sp.]|uniref:DMT family transporter n=1 Tax=Flectobacillus sp. TaxID=50419 RepID=UPI003B9C914E